jgi:hypothetical protein
LVLHAAPVSLVFPPALAREISDALERRFGFMSDSQYFKVETFIGKLSPPGLVWKPDDQVFHSDELPEITWEQLQRRAAQLVGSNETPHLQFMTATRGAYITGILEPQLVKVNQSYELPVASLASLIRELLLYSSAAQLPVERTAMQKMYDTCRRESQPDLPTLGYLQLMSAAQVASRVGCALWMAR